MPVLLHIKKHWVTFITSPDYLRPNQIGLNVRMSLVPIMKLGNMKDMLLCQALV